MQQQVEQTVLERLIDEKGLRKMFIAAQVGISPAYLTLILQRQRPAPDGFADKVALVISVPAWVFFKDDQLLTGSAGASPEVAVSTEVTAGSGE